MKHDRLRLDLADLAEEVNTADLHDRVLHTSRRLVIQRAIVTSAAVLALFGATGTALAVIPRADGPAPLPADSPSVTVSPSPPADPSPSPSLSSSPPAEQPGLPGTRYYLSFGDEATVHAVQGDAHNVVTRFPLSDDDLCPGNTLTVSPDGRWVAYVKGSSTDRHSGELLVGALGEPGERPVMTSVLSDVNCLGSRALLWNGNDLLGVRLADTRFVLLDVAAKEPVAGSPRMENVEGWSADGRWLAAQEDGTRYVTDGQQVRKYDYTPPADEALKWDGWAVRSISTDGRYVAVGWHGTDPSRQDDSFDVVDTTTGATVPLPGEGEIRSILFTADDKVLVRRANGISVLDSSFEPLATVVEPVEFQRLDLLAYRV
ncbi:hypothetical protein [Salinispora tropica]|uniref:WD40 domain protein beta Propeller n=1 Tax=Salinispora tropica (strain ATCC BAA-916 / DSM 44818 / JCM 13857 / NBRC 105044 / CNB-440) TaxID=369723 RepID=A4X9L7_SALTO|nr:hypothetical protein [Salinispora tropica]ABP55591.1 hypothetical protein Strop_3157 [Salinispora tropica CNB-440]